MLEERGQKKFTFTILGMNTFKFALASYQSQGQLCRTELRQQLVTHLYCRLRRRSCPASNVVEGKMNIKEDEKQDLKNYKLIPKVMHTEHPDDVRLCFPLLSFEI